MLRKQTTMPTALWHYLWDGLTSKYKRRLWLPVFRSQERDNSIFTTFRFAKCGQGLLALTISWMHVFFCGICFPFTENTIIHISTRGFLCNNHPKASFILQNLGLLLQKAKHGSSCSLCIIDHSLMFKRLGSENLSPPKYPNLPNIKYEKSQISQIENKTETFWWNL